MCLREWLVILYQQNKRYAFNSLEIRLTVQSPALLTTSGKILMAKTIDHAYLSLKRVSAYTFINARIGILKGKARRFWIVTTRNQALVLTGLMLWGVSVPAFALNPVQIENAIPAVPADADWNVFQFPVNAHDIEGYADKTSVQVGSSIRFFANVNGVSDPQYKLTVYRLGWYHGVGARRMTTPVALTSVTQVLPTSDPITGLVEANWTNPYTLNVPANWVSGIYVATLVGNTTGKGQYIPFVVKNDTVTAPYLFQSSDTTWQAYNAWGGKSLYSFNSSNGIPARKVSYNRPYSDGGGLGQLTLFELQTLRFLEKQGYDVTYQSNIDTHIGGQWQLTKHKAFLSVGHDEYWTKAIRDNVENAKAQGLSLGFFGANAAYWQIRLENSAVTGFANRTIVGYKDVASTQDPFALDGNLNNNTQITTTWRDTRYYNRPENALLGIMYFYNPVNGDMVVSNANHWAYTGTGLHNGDKLVGLLGYEVDAYFSNGKAPAGVEILAHSPINLSNSTIDPSKGYYSDMSVYTQACTLTPCFSPTATVFAVGSLQWAWGLDSFYTGHALENPAAQRITRNVLARMVGAPLPSS
jgi:hypothetical protein